MPKKRRTNPNNPSCSSMVQHVLEYKDLGGSMNLTLSDFLKMAQEDSAMQKLVKEVDKAVDRKSYPDSSITFHKTARGVETHRFLSGRDNKVLDTFSDAIDQANLVQMSTRDIEKAAGVDRAAARESIKSLMAKGCIAVEKEGTRNIAAVYMVNPEITTVGNSKASDKRFWELTGTVYKDGGKGREVETFSEPHMEWIKLTAVRSYTVGSHTEGKFGDPQYKRYNVLHFLGEKKVISSSGNDETTPTENNDL